MRTFEYSHSELNSFFVVTGIALSVIFCFSSLDSSPNMFFFSSILFVHETWLPRHN